MATTIRKRSHAQEVLLPKPLQEISDVRICWDDSGRKILAAGVYTPILLDFAHEDDSDPSGETLNAVTPGWLSSIRR